MTGNTDYVGIATIITAIGGVLIGLVGAIAALLVNKKVSTGNGRTIGQNSENIVAAVTTPPGVPPLGQVAADVADAVKP